MSTLSYARHRFPPAIIQHAVWLYFRFALSYRDVEDLLAERGIDVSYETVRRWALKFGRVYAARTRPRRPRPSGPLASGRGLHPDRRKDPLPLACRRRRGRSSRHHRAAAAQPEGGPQADAPAAETARIPAGGHRHRSPSVLRCGFPRSWPERSPCNRRAVEQPRGGLAPADAPPRKTAEGTRRHCSRSLRKHRFAVPMDVHRSITVLATLRTGLRTEWPVRDTAPEPTAVFSCDRGCSIKGELEHAPPQAVAPPEQASEPQVIERV